MSEQAEEVGCNICSSPKGMAAMEEQLLCAAGSCLRQLGPSGSSVPERLESLALHLFLGEETNYPPCFAVRTLRWDMVVAPPLCCGLGSLKRGVMGSMEDQPQGSRNLFVVLLQSEEGKALHWEQRGGPNPQTRPSQRQERCVGSVSSPRQGLVVMASPHTGSMQQGWGGCLKRWQEGTWSNAGGHGAMLGDMAWLRGPLGPIACSACS